MAVCHNLCILGDVAKSGLDTMGQPEVCVSKGNIVFQSFSPHFSILIFFLSSVHVRLQLLFSELIQGALIKRRVVLLKKVYI